MADEATTGSINVGEIWRLELVPGTPYKMLVQGIQEDERVNCQRTMNREPPAMVTGPYVRVSWEDFLASGSRIWPA